MTSTMCTLTSSCPQSHQATDYWQSTHCYIYLNPWNCIFVALLGVSWPSWGNHSRNLTPALNCQSSQVLWLFETCVKMLSILKWILWWNTGKCLWSDVSFLKSSVQTMVYLLNYNQVNDFCRNGQEQEWNVQVGSYCQGGWISGQLFLLQIPSNWDVHGNHWAEVFPSASSMVKVLFPVLARDCFVQH